MMRDKAMRFNACFFIMLALVSFLYYGCGGKEKSSSVARKTPVVKTVAKKPKKEVDKALQAEEEAIRAALKQEGYVYQRRGRRDPFTPLIVPLKKQKKDKSKVGTIEGYDLNEFALTAIAKKGDEYYALLVTPDNRSFTVKEGDTIGMNNGKVKEITSDKVRMVEYIRNYKGELRPRQIILEFHKGE
ncbi:MAG: pilus assembly protein PilP [Deferribacteres bacterium]|nr:pilus assembly protein PilP [Deferribacteres bacterium]